MDAHSLVPRPLPRREGPGDEARMPMAFTALICNWNNVRWLVICKFIAAVQYYMHVLRQLRRGFCTTVLHLYSTYIKESYTTYMGLTQVRGYGQYTLKPY